MEFFCPVCQKKHPVTDIGIDMLLLFREKIIENLQHIADKETLDGKKAELEGELPICSRFRELVNKSSSSSDFKATIFEFHGTLSRYLKSNPDTGNRFVVSGSKIATADQTNSNIVKWTQTVSLKDVLDCYSAQEDLTQNDRKVLKRYRELVPAEVLNEAVLSEELQVYFSRIKCEGKTELILEKVTDIQGGLFPSGATEEMLGFVRVCPHCGHHLSEAVGREREIVIGLAGGERAGKTATMAAIAAALSGGKYEHLGLDMQIMQHDKMWKDRLAKDVERYREGRGINKTEVSGKNMAGLQTRSLLVRFGKQQRVFTFVDMPGEMWAGDNGLTNEFFRQYSGLYTALDCIWLMVSKFTVYQYGQNGAPVDPDKFKLVAEDSDTVRAADPRTLDSSLSTLKSHLAGLGCAMPPIAVIITKSDVCMTQKDMEAVQKYDLFPPKGEVVARNRKETSEVLQKEHNGNVQLKEYAFWSRGALVRNFLCESNNGSLPRAVERNCQKRFYFALSPYGHPAAKDSSDPANPPTPYRELFPLLWTMAITGMIPISHTCRYQKVGLLFGKIKSSSEATENLNFDYRRNEELSPIAQDVQSNMFFAKGNYSLTFYKNGKIDRKG